MARVCVTGSNRGIGLEFCRQLSERGDAVIAVCRSASDELKKLAASAKDFAIVEGVDVSSEDGAKKLAAAPEITAQKLDVLINNAGILRSESLGNLNVDSIREQFMVNSVGPLLITHALLGQLASPGKVAIVTSRMGSIADNTSGGMYGYRMSKTAVNMAGVSLAHDLKDRKIAVGILHPGYVKTDMTNHNGMIEPQESVKGMLARLDELTLDTSGHFWHTNGEALPW